MKDIELSADIFANNTMSFLFCLTSYKLMLRSKLFKKSLEINEKRRENSLFSGY